MIPEVDGEPIPPTGICRIGVDVDTPYEEFLPYKIHRVMESIKNIPVENRPVIVNQFYRRSCNGNVHILIELDKPVSFLRSLQIRAWLGDDPIRIKMDLRRTLDRGYFNTYDRLFCLKTDGATTKISGPWVRF